MLCLRALIVESFTTPLLFETTSGWAYGGGPELTGVRIASTTKCMVEDAAEDL